MTNEKKRQQQQQQQQQQQHQQQQQQMTPVGQARLGFVRPKKDHDLEWWGKRSRRDCKEKGKGDLGRSRRGWFLSRRIGLVWSVY
jgi:hypothetical protein